MSIYKRRFSVFAIMALMAASVIYGCSLFFNEPDVSNPKLQWSAFDIIGREGLKEKVTADQLQGAYQGKARFIRYAAGSEESGQEDDPIELLQDGEFVCAGIVEKDKLILTLEYPNGDVIVFDDIPSYILEDGILTASAKPEDGVPSESEQTLICAIKTYTSGLMMDGILKTVYGQQDNSFASVLHFQLILEKGE